MTSSFGSKARDSRARRGRENSCWWRRHCVKGIGRAVLADVGVGVGGGDDEEKVG